MNSSPRFSIVIPSHQNQDSLMMTLISLQRIQSHPSFEVLVVCNTSDDTSLTALPEKFPHVHFLCSEKMGVNAARNLGALKAQAEFVLFLDDDVRIQDPRILQKYESAFSLFPEASAIGGPYLENSTHPLVHSYAELRDSWQQAAQLNEDGESLGLLGGNLCVRKSIFTAGLFFDEDIVFGAAETEFLLRLYQLGYRLKFDPDLSVLHFGSEKKLLRKVFKQSYQREALRTKGYNLSIDHMKMRQRHWPNLILFLVAAAGTWNFHWTQAAESKQATQEFLKLLLKLPAQLLSTFVPPLQSLPLLLKTVEKYRIARHHVLSNIWYALYPLHVVRSLQQIWNLNLPLEQQSDLQKLASTKLIYPLKAFLEKRAKSKSLKNR